MLRRLTRGPVVFVDEVEAEAAALGLLEPCSNGLPPLLGMVGGLETVPGVQKRPINVLVYHLADFFLNLWALHFAVPKPERHG